MGLKINPVIKRYFVGNINIIPEASYSDNQTKTIFSIQTIPVIYTFYIIIFRGQGSI